MRWTGSIWHIRISTYIYRLKRKFRFMVFFKKISKLEYIGFFLTVFYFSVIFLFFQEKIILVKALDLNSVEGFLSGIFGPMTFAWLIIGHLTNSMESKQSRDWIKREQQLQMLEHQPDFLFRDAMYGFDNGFVRDSQRDSVLTSDEIQFTIKNIGARATRIKIKTSFNSEDLCIDVLDNSQEIYQKFILKNAFREKSFNKKVETVFKLSGNPTGKLVVSYLDRWKERRSIEYSMTISRVQNKYGYHDLIISDEVSNRLELKSQ